VRRSHPMVPVVLAVIAIAGCATAYHAATGQRASPAASPRPAEPVVAAHAAGLPGTAGWTTPPKRQLGIDMDFYAGPGLNVAASAQADVSYIKSLHGNALSVSFPFFMHGWNANGVYTTDRTPSPAQLGLVAKAAHGAGLYMSIRPLLDESSLNHAGGRTHWAPRHAAAWFASYENFIKPYAQMAQKDHIGEFIIGVEFDKLNGSPYWGKVASYVRKYYHGILGYSDNWDIAIRRRVSAAGVVQTVDAYPPLKLAPTASLAAVARSWDSYLGSEARGIVVSEIGIAAQRGAYAKPYRLTWPGEPLDPVIQERWFTGACDAVAREKDAGIYFWSINLAQAFNKPPLVSDPTQFVDGGGATAISACFEYLR
jgi:hypothetical protein